MTEPFLLRPGALTLFDLRAFYEAPREIALDPACWAGVEAAAEVVARVVAAGETVYGVNTGFGKLARTTISADEVRELQRRLVLSHAAGTGPPLGDDVVRLTMVLKIASLARGHSGVGRPLIEALAGLVNAGVYPVVPGKGSAGASGDLVHAKRRPLTNVKDAETGEEKLVDMGHVGDIVDVKGKASAMRNQMAYPRRAAGATAVSAVRSSSTADTAVAH